jgi:ribosomal protein S27AE
VTWKPIITAVAAAIGRAEEGVAMIDALERGASGRPFSLERIDVDAFLAELDRTMRRDHAQWSPQLLAQGGAMFRTLSRLFAQLSTARPERPLDSELLRRELERLAGHATVKDEPAGQVGRRCPRCGFANMASQKTTATGRFLVEWHCRRCGWFDDEDLGPAPDYGSRS